MRNKGKVDLFDSRHESGGDFLSNTEEKKEDGKITIIENGTPEKSPIEDLLNQVFVYSLRVGMEYGKEILERTNGDPEKIKEELGDLCDTAMSLLNEIKIK